MARRKKVRRRQRKQRRTERARAAPSIEFCSKCSSIMVPIKRGRSTYLKCRSCGSEKKRDLRSLKIVEEVKRKKGVVILEKNSVPLPLAEKICPKCGHERSHWWLQQTRTADEPPTQFFRCEKCKYTWREYK